jgi:hypothetical protein
MPQCPEQLGRTAFPFGRAARVTVVIREYRGERSPAEAFTPEPPPCHNRTGASLLLVDVAQITMQFLC